MPREARIRLGAFGRKRFEIRAATETEATRREAKMRDVAHDMVEAKLAAEAKPILERMGIARDEEAFQISVRLAEGLCEGRIPRRKVTGASMTFKMLGEEWTSGRLHRAHPDQIRLKRTGDHDGKRLDLHVYPVIGDKPVSTITLDHCEDVMRRLPSDLAPATRRNVGQLMTRLLKLAVYPLRMIGASPIPPGFLPTAKQRKALGYLYPDEDRRLMACTNVPLCFRLLWGFFSREGMREGEALALTWGDLDLTRGAVRLDKNKTDDPRAWPLDPGTAEGLRRYRATRGKPEATDLVFVDPQGRAHSKFGLALLLRSHLEAVGLKKERPELFKTTAERQQIRVHDLRGTFVTVSLANDRTESWISDRTGHRSSAMINRYKRTARSFDELGLGALAQLYTAIPEFRDPEVGHEPPPVSGPEVGQEFMIPQKTSASPRGFESKAAEQGDTWEPKTAAPSDSEIPGEPRRPTQNEGMGHVLDAVEAALSDALRGATAAGEWALVGQLARELEARRAARQAPEVVSLDAARRRRER